MTQPTFIDRHLNESSQEFHYYPFAVKLDRCVGSHNALNNLCNKVCFPNKTEDLNLSVFNMIRETNESNVNADLLYKNVTQINGGIMINVDMNINRLCLDLLLVIEKMEKI